MGNNLGKHEDASKMFGKVHSLSIRLYTQFASHYTLSIRLTRSLSLDIISLLVLLPLPPSSSVSSLSSFHSNPNPAIGFGSIGY